MHTLLSCMHLQQQHADNEIFPLFLAFKIFSKGNLNIADQVIFMAEEQVTFKYPAICTLGIQVLFLTFSLKCAVAILCWNPILFRINTGTCVSNSSNGSSKTTESARPKINK
ncbi:hypothetical protein CDAR_542351 [Caerostris darwini]|uniref:Uncharacterized protein n=1 Tax=Caerostris darwini TaxID=1538125 RepID=A0AAV4S169_9ARAC|nr:hypothetical protein CDAR_543361 [Caerostris darwini]GIY86478.1 hypothetical protein CDAR_542351 [Caerostris darwini]